MFYIEGLLDVKPKLSTRTLGRTPRIATLRMRNTLFGEAAQDLTLHVPVKIADETLILPASHIRMCRTEILEKNASCLLSSHCLASVGVMYRCMQLFIR